MFFEELFSHGQKSEAEEKEEEEEEIDSWLYWPCRRSHLDHVVLMYEAGGCPVGWLAG